MATQVIERQQISESVSAPRNGVGILDRNAAFAVVFITLLAALLRIHAVGSKSFLLDEGMSVEYARLPWRVFLRTLWSREANMAVYYVMLRYWLMMGRSEGFVRGLSVLFSVATVPFIYSLGRRLFDRQTGLVAAFLLAINAYHIRYAQEARGYALVVFLCVLASWLFVRNLQQPLSSHWGAYAASCVVAVYSHFYAGLVVVAHLASLAVRPWKDLPRKEIARNFFWFTCLIAPIAIFVFRTGLEPIGWIMPVQPGVLLRFGVELSGNYGELLLILVVLAIGSAALAAQRAYLKKDGADPAWRYLFLFSWLFVPLAIVVAASLLRPLFFTRFLNPCLPALILLVAAGVLSVRPRVLGWLLLSAVSIFSVLGTAAYYKSDFDVDRPDWRAAADYVFAKAHPGDSIFFYHGNGQPPFDFYRWQRNPLPVWPKSLNPSYATEDSGMEYSMIPGTSVRAAKPEGDRVWLVLLFSPGPDGLPDQTATKVRDWFAAGRHRVEVHRPDPIGIVLFENDSPGPTAKNLVAR